MSIHPKCQGNVSSSGVVPFRMLSLLRNVGESQSPTDGGCGGGWCDDVDKNLFPVAWVHVRSGTWEWLAPVMSFACKLETSNKNGLNLITCFVQALGQIDIRSNTNIYRFMKTFSENKTCSWNCVHLFLRSTSQLSFVCENWLILILKFLANLGVLPSHMGIVKAIKGSRSTNQISWNAMSVFFCSVILIIISTIINPSSIYFFGGEWLINYRGIIELPNEKSHSMYSFDLTCGVYQ